MAKTEGEVQVLQAVVLGDSFDTCFRPITLETPRALLPLVNVPMLEYTLECLSRAGVDEIYVFCTAHAAKIREYLERSKWRGGEQGVKVECVTMTTCLSVGDALREVDARAIIKSDFILVSGDVVSNIPLAKVVEEHRQRSTADKDIIMTTVLKKVSGHSRFGGENGIFGLDPADRIVYYESPNEGSKKIQVKMDLFDEHPAIAFRQDLLDCRIDICSPKVLFLFTDNFDYCDLRNDFLKGLLNAEIMGHKIRAHITSEPTTYAARVDSLAAYSAVTADVLRRWAFPLVPEENVAGCTSFSARRACRYQEPRVRLSPECTVGPCTAIGEGTEVAAGARVVRSVVGRGCVIGRDAVVEDSVLWAGAKVGEGAVVRHALLCDSAAVLPSATVGPDVVVSFRAVVGTGMAPPQGSRITLEADDWSDGSGWSDGCDGDAKAKSPVPEAEWDVALVGPDGAGRGWACPEDGPRPQDSLVPPPPGAPTTGAESEESTGSASSMSEEEEEVFDAQERFRREVRDTVLRAAAENHRMDNVILEINGVKFAFDRTFTDCAAALLPAILDLIPREAFIPGARRVLSEWRPLFEKFLQGIEEQVELVLCLQELCVEEDHLFKHFAALLQLLYEAEVVSEDAVLQWSAADQADATEQERALREQATRFVEWLEESGETESGEGESSEGSSSGSESS